ncbi:methylmalonyl Co-A mutase-associated GTPase MeaB [Bacillus suaedaesalsae]|uniref:Methylmalonyl Co-A mutase-associated GTPase MeaB n=1 Tax=Bacillus suaedaesalsae TaxID=2810349 RepID=A0ABS2DFV4_9BACI|nr:methylmalonyl Co-A mutase-associated GTPase MeaB [Bacillus suaedaesalsae]MBM6617364.1 methylmalonyl Co-A mutase-associated GTPase MeaB [Bacillus suaedaesalsae]
MTDRKPKIPRKREKTATELSDGVLQGNRAILAQAITLIESNAPRHFEKAQELLNLIIPSSGKSIRIGITGVPGAGKSTFIEAFGMYLCELGHKVAVLAVDPSSSVTGGSILGDKTRMEQLSRHPHAYVRPSPSAGTLGGVAKKTRETILLCEAAGYDVIIVETVGVGQSEVAVRSMVDIFLLLALTGAGDELQGMKKGIMELTDLLLINKADGDNEQKALRAKQEFSRILHFLRPATKGWSSKALTCSALYQIGIDTVWNNILEYEKVTKESNVFQERREAQMKDWFYTMIVDRLQTMFFQHSTIKQQLPILESQILSGKLSASLAVNELFEEYERAK